MDEKIVYDALVVGSGPSGAMAARTLVAQGLGVLVVDAGFTDEKYRKLIPDRPFSEIRRDERDQARFFLGDDFEGVPTGNVRVGAQLTPPRQYITRRTDELLPITGVGFEPMQSLALGGLGEGWGTASFTYSDEELKRIGIFEPGFASLYDEVIDAIGVSGDPESDTSSFAFFGTSRQQPALEMDSNGQSLLKSYLNKRNLLNSSGFFMGRPALAVLSRDHLGRRRNAFQDMDFWGDSARSAYRPSYTFGELTHCTNFSYRAGLLAIRFEEDCSGEVLLSCKDIQNGEITNFRSRSLILCAGAINSARIALNSLPAVTEPSPILCNPYTYIPSINISMLGRPAKDRRHSFTQLWGIYRPTEQPDDLVSLQFYSYRSLLLFKLVKEMPLPTWAGLLIARFLLTSLTIIGIHHSDSPDASSRLRIVNRTRDGAPELEISYHEEAQSQAVRKSREWKIIRNLVKIGCIPLGRIHPGNASSIHYAGTVPIQAVGSPSRLSSGIDGKVFGTERVFIGDSAGWNYLPAKGLTLTLMANAIRIARKVALELKGRHA